MAIELATRFAPYTDEQFAAIEERKNAALAELEAVQTKIAEAQLNSDGDVDLSVYVTQDELNTRIEQIQESVVYGEF